MLTGPKTTVQFPVQFEELGSSLAAAFEPPPQPTAADQSPTLLPSHPLPDLSPWGPSSVLPPSSSSFFTEQPAHNEKAVPLNEWPISTELRTKCCHQFQELQPSHGRLLGDKARTFFIQSRLPNADLSAIW